MLVNKLRLNNIGIDNGYINIPLSSQFSIETQQYENIEDSFDLTSSDIITPIIDLEKVKLCPVSSNSVLIENSDAEYTDSLNIRLHFINTDYIGGWDITPTKITDIGFTTDDIKNKRNRLSNSFIRLLFYDSDNLKTQNLLYYSTIYLDIDYMYSKYILESTVDNIYTEFIVQNPRLSNKIKSFEGFNIYLFKGDVPKDQIKSIYMRIDFNNAFNGKSTLFTREKPETEDGYYIQQLYENLFYKINCVYKNSEKKYIYSFEGLPIEQNSSNYDKHIKKVINIDAYQAKVI